MSLMRGLLSGTSVGTIMASIVPAAPPPAVLQQPGLVEIVFAEQMDAWLLSVLRHVMDAAGAGAGSGAAAGSDPGLLAAGAVAVAQALQVVLTDSTLGETACGLRCVATGTDTAAVAAGAGAGAEGRALSRQQKCGLVLLKVLLPLLWKHLDSSFPARTGGGGSGTSVGADAATAAARWAKAGRLVVRLASLLCCRLPYMYPAAGAREGALRPSDLSLQLLSAALVKRSGSIAGEDSSGGAGAGAGAGVVVPQKPPVPASSAAPAAAAATATGALSSRSVTSWLWVNRGAVAGAVTAVVVAVQLADWVVRWRRERAAGGAGGGGEGSEGAEGAVGCGLPVPPPPPPRTTSGDAGAAEGADMTAAVTGPCALCQRSPCKRPAATTGGAVCCYDCIVLNLHAQQQQAGGAGAGGAASVCPLSGLPCAVEDLVVLSIDGCDDA